MTDTASRRLIRTKQGTEVEIAEDHLVTLPDGLMGFPDIREYALLPHGPDSPFIWMQSVDEPALAFITMDPLLFVPEYRPDVAIEDLAAIGLDSLEGAWILAIIVIPEDPKKMTANLQGPVVINPQTRQGVQVISRSFQHKVRHFILGEPGAGA